MTHPSNDRPRRTATIQKAPIGRVKAAAIDLIWINAVGEKSFRKYRFEWCRKILAKTGRLRHQLSARSRQ
jgi:hypothetical protein